MYAVHGRVELFNCPKGFAATLHSRENPQCVMLAAAVASHQSSSLQPHYPPSPPPPPLPYLNVTSSTAAAMLLPMHHGMPTMQPAMHVQSSGVCGGLQVASVMGLMSVALDLLLLIHPMSNAQDEQKEVSSSRQDLKNDMQDLEAAGFLKPCKETPDSWDFAQVPLPSPPLPCPVPCACCRPYCTCDLLVAVLLLCCSVLCTMV